jgi:hypothetical protein
MTWVGVIPRNIAAKITLNSTDAGHHQLLLVEVHGLAPVTLGEDAIGRPMMIRAAAADRQIKLTPRSQSSAGTVDSRWSASIVVEGRSWRFGCDDGPGGDGDFNDLIFTFELERPSGPPPPTPPLPDCRQCQCLRYTSNPTAPRTLCWVCGHGRDQHRSEVPGPIPGQNIS